MNNNKITNLTTPETASEAANKSYVDSAASAAQSAATAVGNAAQTTANTAKTTADALVVTTSAGSATTSAMRLYPATGTTATIVTNGVTRMTVTTDGNVGIGPSHTAPTATLDVSGAAKISSLSVSGNVGIGTGDGTSRASLDVIGGKAFNTGNYLYYFIDWGNYMLSANSYPLVGILPRNQTLSIYASNDILIGGTILRNSDKRIKKNIGDIDGNTALSQIRKLQPKIYNYIDEVSKQGYVYGFIAQNVEDIILHSSIKTKDYIPNFYCKGIIETINKANHIYEISTVNEIKFEKVIDTSGNEISNYKIKLYDATNNEYICSVINIIDSKKMTVKCNKEYIFSTIEEYKNAVFIYGQEVNDFYNLDENAIFTVATAALQEVDRQQQADKARIAELEAKVSEQQSLINDILERLKTLERT